MRCTHKSNVAGNFQNIEKALKDVNDVTVIHIVHMFSFQQFCLDDQFFIWYCLGFGARVSRYQNMKPL